MERIKQFFKSFLLVEMLKGMKVTGRYLFAPKITVHYPEEKTPQSPRFRGFMHYAVTLTGKSAVLHASCVRLYVRPWRLLSNQNSVTIVRAGPLVTIST